MSIFLMEIVFMSRFQSIMSRFQSIILHISASPHISAPIEYCPKINVFIYLCNWLTLRHDLVLMVTITPADKTAGRHIFPRFFPLHHDYRNLYSVLKSYRFRPINEWINICYLLEAKHLSYNLTSLPKARQSKLWSLYIDIN